MRYRKHVNEHYGWNEMEWMNKTVWMNGMNGLKTIIEIVIEIFDGKYNVFVFALIVILV